MPTNCLHSFFISISDYYNQINEKGEGKQQLKELFKSLGYGLE